MGIFDCDMKQINLANYIFGIAILGPGLRGANSNNSLDYHNTAQSARLQN
jgi:hypothetical protein